MHYKKMISCTIFNMFLLTATISAEFYSSLASLKVIFEAERNISVIINGYVEKELERLDYLKKFAQEVQEHNDKAIRDGEEAIRHPINAFLLIKGMITDWNKIVKIMRSNSADDVIRNVTRHQDIKCINYPTEEDLIGAATGLLRLQDTFQMDTKDIADGKISNSQMRTVALTAEDCLEIGRAAYNAYDYYHTILWMREALERLEKERVPTANLEDILEYLAFSQYKQGNLKRALLLTDELYRINPDHPRAKDNVKEYEYLLKNNEVQRIDLWRKTFPINNMRNDNEFDEGIKLIYEALCRREVPVNTKVQSQLYCYYKTDRPYLRLAPFKVEIVRQNPLNVLFYGIISDEQARIIQMLAVPKLNGSRIYNDLTGSFELPSFRILKSARLRSTEYETVKRIDKRLELATNLEIETAEDLAVLNYGIGGQFEPHFDCALKGDQCFEKLGTGNRIATFLIYLTEPEIGGRTVFTSNLKISVPCVKNAALFWYNLMRNGEVDTRSLHAACPVATGIKWTANKWFHERGQEWRRPCGLNQFDQERYVGDLGTPEPKHLINIRSETKKFKKMKKKNY
uniref:procollagen-proline 4-dioxygenase n=1 Tax=Onchocerca volvulus TaxID=6282 RepID=Q95W53_ONCVO|nr:prolyl-4-hydroxylase alpha subunit-like protein [Onchocerca volvulus]